MYRFGLIARELIRPGNDGQKLSLGAIEFVGVDEVVDGAPVVRLIEEALAEEEGAVRSFTVGGAGLARTLGIIRQPWRGLCHGGGRERASEEGYMKDRSVASKHAYLRASGRRELA
jgi:hypothetical protein